MILRYRVALLFATAAAVATLLALLAISFAPEPQPRSVTPPEVATTQPIPTQWQER